jgi:hypothetical protein
VASSVNESLLALYLAIDLIDSAIGVVHDRGDVESPPVSTRGASERRAGRSPMFEGQSASEPV